jgi:hypothetical protein
LFNEFGGMVGGRRRREGEGRDRPLIASRSSYPRILTECFGERMLGDVKGVAEGMGGEVQMLFFGPGTS